jgi:hypothetical protein
MACDRKSPNPNHTPLCQPLSREELNMAIIAEVSWDQFVDGHFPQADFARKAFREAVEAIADKARTAIPSLNGRVERAVQIILNGDLSIAPDGQGTIASQSNGNGAYNVGKGDTCSCKDHPKAPKHLCKHVLAYHIFTRATALAKQRLAELDAATNGTITPAPEQVDEALVATPVQETVATPILPLPEAASSANCYVTLAGRQVQLTLRDHDEQRLLLRLETLLQKFPVVEEPKEPAQKEGWCYKHNVQMKLNHGKRGSWGSHKLPNGQWCNQR